MTVNLIISACSVSNKTVNNKDVSLQDQLLIKLHCYQNAMPLSTSKPYVVIDITSKNGALTDNLKVVELSAKGEKGTWQTSTFDTDDFMGKETENYQNNARDFDISIGSQYDFKITVESETKGTFIFNIENVNLETVY